MNYSAYFMGQPESIHILSRVGGRVRARRGELGLTGKELAEASGLSPRFISQLEGGTANIAIGRLADVAGALGVSVASLVEQEGEVLAIVGLRGAGKTTLGRRLAGQRSVPFVELDERIEELAGLSVAEIFSVHGEDYYRRLETQALERLVGEDGLRVVALSGGIVGNGAAFALLRRRCTMVWLKASPEDHMHRVLAQGDQRPMANRSNAMEELRALLEQREPLYRQAEAVVDTSAGTEAEAFESLVRSVQALSWGQS